jgi:hypothetical protein
MCQDLNSLRDSIVSYAARFDPSLVSCAQAGDVVLTCARIEASVAGIKALAAARVAEGSSWLKDGYRSPADELANKAKMSPVSAKRTLETGRRLTNQPKVAKAALSGQLSPEQTAIVAEGVEANPNKESELIDAARAGSLSELSEEVARVKAAATDLEARRKAIHARRSFRRWSDRDGALQGHLYGKVEDGASMWSMLDPIQRRLAALRDSAGHKRESFDALAYDALVAIAEIAAGRESELSLVELIKLGLFPQLEPEMLADREAERPSGSEPGERPSGEPADRPSDGPNHPTDGPNRPTDGPNRPTDGPTNQPSVAPANGRADESSCEPADGPDGSVPPRSASGPVATPPVGAAAPGSAPARSAPRPRATGPVGAAAAGSSAAPSAPGSVATPPAGVGAPGRLGDTPQQLEDERFIAGLFSLTEDSPAAEPSLAASGAQAGSSEPAGPQVSGASDVAADRAVRSKARKRRDRRLAGSAAQVMIRVDLDALLRGVAIEGELCEISGYGPVPVSVIEELAANDNTFLVGILTKATQVVSVYHHRRRPNAHQRSALRFVYPSCAAAGCNSKVGLQNDHRKDWARTKYTVFDLLDRLCTHHHDLKTYHGWQLVKGTGKRAFVPPSDPRHPGRDGAGPISRDTP